LLVENAVFMKSEEKTMTLSVPTDDAPKVVLAEGTGTLCVILRRVKNNDEHSIIGKKLLERFEPK
jgi:Flp pilus assembly protein CpaB